MWREATLPFIFSVLAVKAFVLFPVGEGLQPVATSTAGLDQKLPLSEARLGSGAWSQSEGAVRRFILSSQGEEKKEEEKEEKKARKAAKEDEEETQKGLRCRKEAEQYLKALEKQRETLVGDFFGINLTARRYDLVFDRLGFIRFRIKEVDEEIRRVKAFLRGEIRRER